MPVVVASGIFCGLTRRYGPQEVVATRSNTLDEVTHIADRAPMGSRSTAFSSSSNRSCANLATNSGDPTGLPTILMPNGLQTAGFAIPRASFAFVQLDPETSNLKPQPCTGRNRVSVTAAFSRKNTTVLFVPAFICFVSCFFFCSAIFSKKLNLFFHDTAGSNQ